MNDLETSIKFYATNVFEMDPAGAMNYKAHIFPYLVFFLSQEEKEMV